MTCKTFELKPLIENFPNFSDKVISKIECIESSGRNLYIGTNDSFVVHYYLEEEYLEDGSLTMSCNRGTIKSLGNKKPIFKMKSASALDHLFVLMDCTIYALSLNSLEECILNKKFKNVLNFCLNENPSNYDPFSVQMCLVKKKQLLIFNITNADAIHIASVGTLEPAIDLAMDGDFICAASRNMYDMYTWMNDHSQPLFPFLLEETVPIVGWIGQNEFLLNGPSQLGMFATTAGVSERPPVQWVEPPVSFTFFHPYLLACGTEFISIYSILDKQMKQTFPVKSCKKIGNFDGRVFVCSNSTVNVLCPIPWEKQVQTLLSSGFVEDAISIAENSYKVGLTTEAAIKIIDRVKQQGAFILFAKGDFHAASHLFKCSNFDIRELICLYPGLLPGNSQFHRSVPPLHDIPDINHVTKGKNSELIVYKQFLLNFLEDLVHDSFSKSEEVETAVIKLCCDINPSKIYDLLEMKHNFLGSQKDIIDCLNIHDQHHALGLYYVRSGQHDLALQVWAKLLTGDLQDKDFPGLEFFVQQVAKVPDSSLIWKYSEFIMNRDQERGVLIFTKNETSKELDQESIIKFLRNFEDALLLYLEFIVEEAKSDKEFHHTQLAISYINKISTNKNKDGYRKKLQFHLEKSINYNKPFLLQKLNGTDLYMERSLLHGKSGKHDLALKVLLDEAKDPSAAELYCTRMAKNKDKRGKQKIFFELLSLYLQENINGKQDEYLGAIVSLLNNPDVELDPVSVHKVLPDHWSLQLCSSFIRRSLENCLHEKRMLKLENRLHEVKLLHAKYISYGKKRYPVMLDSSKYCCVCMKPFVSPQFALFPNGLQTHIECAGDRKVCPLTGQTIRDTSKDIVADSFLI